MIRGVCTDLLVVSVAALLAFGGSVALAESHAAHAGHSNDHGAAHAGHGEVPADAGESTRAFIAANAAMHAGMDIEFTGDADVDFVRGMIPHHQGAIDMARIVLEHGQDAEIRALAEEIIAAQEVEIATMEAWLAARGQLGVTAEVSDEVRRACRFGFREVESMAARSRLDAHTAAQVEAFLAGIDEAEAAGDPELCQQHIGELRKIFHLDH